MINMLFRNLKNLLILPFFILSSCQLTQSNAPIKEAVTNTQKEIKNESRVEELNEVASEKINETNTKNEISKLPEKKLKLSDKKDDKKRILDFFSDFFKSKEEQESKNDLIIKNTKENSDNNKSNEKQPVSKNLVNNQNNEQNEDLYKQIKPKDDKRILDFFTKFFDYKENKVKEEIILKEPSKIEPQELQKPTKLVEDEILNIEENIIQEGVQEKLEDNAKTIISKFNEGTYDEDNDEGTYDEDNDEVTYDEDNDEVTYDEYINEGTYDEDNDEEISKNKVLKQIENQKQETMNSEVSKKEIKVIKDLALFDLEQPLVKKGILKKRPSNLIGLLLPLTGDRRSAGNLVLNTFRYSLATNPKNIIFKIYDTKGTEKGVLDAANKGIKDGVETFIGPIFSHETAVLKNEFTNKKSITFFSLSPDLSNVSNNIIVSGQNPEDQIACIVNNLSEKEIKKVLLINHQDKYGEIIKNSLQNNISRISYANTIKLSTLTVFPDQDLNKEIKSISNFESRKLLLKEQRKLISKDSTLTKKEKALKLKKLERQLTFGVPFDAVIIASEGDKLLEILSHLAFYDINANNTLIFGTSLWEDTAKIDKVFENSYFVTNLKNKKSSFSKNYKDVFLKDPMSVNFYLFDLIELVNDYKAYETYPDDKIHIGEFTNSLVNSGFLKRETFIKKNKGNNVTENVFSCSLDVI